MDISSSLIVPHSIRFVNAGKEKSEKIVACPTTSFIELLPPFAVTLSMTNKQGTGPHRHGTAIPPPLPAGPRCTPGERPVPRGGRHAAPAQPGLYRLAGPGDVPHHRRVAPPALVGAPRGLLLRMHHRGIDVQGHAVPLLQGRPGTRRSPLPSVAAHGSERKPISNTSYFPRSTGTGEHGYLTAIQWQAKHCSMPSVWKR